MIDRLRMIDYICTVVYPPKRPYAAIGDISLKRPQKNRFSRGVQGGSPRMFFEQTLLGDITWGLPPPQKVTYPLVN